MLGMPKIIADIILAAKSKKLLWLLENEPEEGPLLVSTIRLLSRGVVDDIIKLNIAKYVFREHINHLYGRFHGE